MEHVRVGPRRRRAKVRAYVIAALFAFVPMPAALVAACSSAATSDIKVQTAVDQKANIKGYRSYAWFASGGVLVDRAGAWVPKNADTQADVEYLVDKSLRERGLRAVKERPDLLVSLLLVADVKDVETIAAKRGNTLTNKLDPVGEGALVAELIDADTGRTVWLAGAEGEVRGSRSVEDGKARLAYAIDKMFAKLPR
jgi:hypothetical protein